MRLKPYHHDLMVNKGVDLVFMLGWFTTGAIKRTQDAAQKSYRSELHKMNKWLKCIPSVLQLLELLVKY